MTAWQTTKTTVHISPTSINQMLTVTALAMNVTTVLESATADKRMTIRMAWETHVTPTLTPTETAGKTIGTTAPAFPTLAKATLTATEMEMPATTMLMGTAFSMTLTIVPLFPILGRKIMTMMVLAMTVREILTEMASQAQTLFPNLVL